MKATPPKSENLEGRSDQKNQDSPFSLPRSHFSPHQLALVPKLRFPGFREAEGWEGAQLGTLLKKNPDYGVNEAAVPFTERLLQYLRITDIS